MKKLIVCLVLLSFGGSLHSQDITISFKPKESGKEIDSIWVTNQNTNEKVKLLSGDSLILKRSTGIIELQNPSRFIYPNPCTGVSKLCLNTKSNDVVKIKINSITGQTISIFTEEVVIGESVFNIKFPWSGVFIVSAQINKEASCWKVICLGSDRQESSIECYGTRNDEKLKQGLTVKTIGFSPGNVIYCLVYSGNNKTVHTDSPVNSKNYTVEFYNCQTADSRGYKTVKIRDHIWMAENLAYLPNVSDWKNGSNNDPYYYVQGYNGTDVSVAKEKQGYKNYGVLYNLPAALKACPAGWHLPSDVEWDELAQFVSDQKGPFEKTDVYWYEVGAYLKASYGWSSSGKGTDDFGFSVLPGGQRTSGGTSITGEFGNFWSSTAYFGTTSYYWYVGGLYKWIKRTTGMNDQGFSVRCIKDEE
jgi:uncharacterized protein (TIGR02145 family)